MKTNNEKNIQLIKDNKIDELIRVNTKYILAIAKAYRQDESILKDLVQEGRIGLVEAASIYDSTINPNFLNIATYYIKKYMLNYLTINGNTIHYPHNYYRVIKKIDKKINNDELYDIYTDDELTNGQRLAYTNAKRVVSGDLYNDEENSVLFNSIAYIESDYEEKTIKEDEARNKLFKLLEKLKADDQKIIKMYYGIDEEQKNIVEIAEHYGCTRQNISLKLKRILKNLSTF